MKNLLTMTMALAAFAMLEQSTKALDFKGGDFLQVRGERHGERSYHPEHMEDNMRGSHPGSWEGEHPNTTEEGHLEQNLQNRNEGNWGNEAGWTGSGTGCMTDSNGNLVCP
ncbi:MAG: hypothetical protein BGO67_10970 [Alphaproteobacteria bacterium 41-28]|nr:MAG: hypothetical protein BGO67_10970 [Alphaproteobacteria bacterium 41-28]